MKRYQLAWAEEQPLLKLSLNTERYRTHRHIVGNVLDDALIWGTGTYIESYFNSTDVKKKVNKDGEKFLTKEIAENTLQEIDATAKNFWIAVKNIREQAKKKLTAEQLIKLFDQLVAVSREVYAYFMCSREEVMHAVETRLAALLRQKFPATYQDALITLTTPTEADVLYNEKKDWMNVIPNPTEEVIQQHIEKYPLLLYNITSEEKAIELMKNKAQKQKTDELQAELRENKEKRRQLKEKQEQLFKEMGSEEIERLAGFIRQMALGRLKLKECWGGTSYYLLDFFRQLAEKAGFSTYDVMNFYTREDMENLVKHGKNISKEELEKRKQNYLLHYLNGKLCLYSGEEARRMKKELLDGSLPKQDTTSFKGMIANTGKVTGRVKLVKVVDMEELNKIAKTLSKDEHILVTGMTNPTMVILLDKVKGIITDEGGLACHAAIVSREFGVPCLVGCKIATQVLKDDDLIELDATNGIVRKVSTP